MALDASEINYLIYCYLKESGKRDHLHLPIPALCSTRLHCSATWVAGFAHSSYVFRNECPWSQQLRESEEQISIKRGALIQVIQRGLQYMQAEAELDQVCGASCARAMAQ